MPPLGLPVAWAVGHDSAFNGLYPLALHSTQHCLLASGAGSFLNVARSHLIGFAELPCGNLIFWLLTVAAAAAVGSPNGSRSRCPEGPAEPYTMVACTPSSCRQPGGTKHRSDSTAHGIALGVPGSVGSASLIARCTAFSPSILKWFEVTWCKKVAAAGEALRATWSETTLKNEFRCRKWSSAGVRTVLPSCMMLRTSTGSLLLL